MLIFTFVLNAFKWCCNFVQRLQGILVRTLGSEMFALANSAHNVLALQCLSHLSLLFVSLLLSSGCLSVWWWKLQWNVFANSGCWKIRSGLVSLLFSKLCPLFSLSYCLVDIFCDKLSFDFTGDLVQEKWVVSQNVDDWRKFGYFGSVSTLTFLPSSLSLYSTITFKPFSSV